MYGNFTNQHECDYYWATHAAVTDHIPGSLVKDKFSRVDTKHHQEILCIVWIFYSYVILLDVGLCLIISFNTGNYAQEDCERRVCHHQKKGIQLTHGNSTAKDSLDYPVVSISQELSGFHGPPKKKSFICMRT